MINAETLFNETFLFPQMIAKHILADRHKMDIHQIWFMKYCEYRLCELFSNNPKAKRILKSTKSRNFMFMLITKWANLFLNDPHAFKKGHPIKEV